MSCYHLKSSVNCTQVEAQPAVDGGEAEGSSVEGVVKTDAAEVDPVVAYLAGDLVCP